MKVKPIPDGYRSLTPYIFVRGGERAIQFYKNVFDATEDSPPFKDPSGKIGHAELKIGDSRLMLADEFPNMGVKSPEMIGGSPVNLVLYVHDVDAVVNRAVTYGARVTRPIENRFYGDRSGQIEDPFGHLWTITTHVEDVSLEEMHRRAKELFGKK